MFRRSRTPPRGNNSRGNKFGKGGNWKKPWTPNYKIKKSAGNSGPANNTIAELKDHYFDCSSIHEADRFITTMKAIVSYMGTNYGGDIATTLENLKVFQPEAPEDPVDKYNYEDIYDDDNEKIIKLAKDQITYSQQKEFDYKMQAYVKRKQNLANHMEKAYWIIYDQCSEPLQNKIKNSPKWPNISANQNCIDLVELIKMLVYKYEEDQYMPLFVFNAKSAFYMFNQGNMALSDYREKYSNLIQVLVSYDIKIYERQVLADRVQKKYKGSTWQWDNLLDTFAKC